MYTDQQIEEALDRYCLRTNSVRDVLRIGPLNQYGIHTIVHSGERFVVIEWLRQQIAAGMVMGSYGDKIRICQEFLLQQNPAMADDENLVHVYAGMPLDVEKKPFFMISYDEKVWDYVLANAQTERELPKAKLMRSKKDISFILAKENDVNAVFPFRIVLDNN